MKINIFDIYILISVSNIGLYSYLVYLFLEWEIFQKKYEEKIKTHILCFITFFRKSRRLWDNVEKLLYSRAGRR